MDGFLSAPASLKLPALAVGSSHCTHNGILVIGGTMNGDVTDVAMG